MKTNKTFAYGILSVILALAFIACPDEKTPESNPPVAHAQAEPTHTLANDLTIALNGTVSTGNITAYAWECVSYTANQGTVSTAYTKAQVDALIANAGTATATVAPRKAGTYVFKLTVTDNEGESDTDNVTVMVKPITHTITVPAITFSQGNSLDFGAVSALIDWNSDFASTDVTYILKLGDTALSNGTTSISATGHNDGYYTLTQTFYYKGNPITNGSRNVVVEVDGGLFVDMYASTPPPFTTVNIPELPLLLSKGELETVNLPLNVTVSFVSLADSPTIDFSPNASLPAGVTYIVTDNSTPQKSWNSAEGFGGQINASEHYDVNTGDITFTQTFYYNGAEITGDNSKRIVEVGINPFSTTFTVGSSTNSVTLKWPAE